MGRKIENSLMALALHEIMSAAGSPYLKLEAEIMLGGFTYVPLVVNQLTNVMDTANNYSDELYLYLTIPKGDIVKYISPYQDDIQVRLRVIGLGNTNTEQDVPTEEGEEISDLSRVYVAYVDDEIPNAISNSNTANANTTELDNLGDIEVIILRLEEMAVNQMKYITIGAPSVRFTTPIDTCRLLLRRYADSIVLPENERLEGPTVDVGSNPAFRFNISIPDGTSLLDVPDIVHNEAGGIYPEALGFYIRNNHMYLWSLYGLKRIEDGSKFKHLQVYLSPDRLSGIVERSWRIPPDDSNILQIWAAGEIDIIDESMELRQKYGDVVEGVQPHRALEGFINIDKNKFSVDPQTLGRSFGYNDSTSGQVIVKKAPPGVNAYVLNSLLSKAQGIKIVVRWNHSLPTLISPGMVMTLFYDIEGEVKQAQGTLLSAHTLITSEGKGVKVQRYTSTTMLTLFISRYDEFYMKWKDDGFKGANIYPDQEGVNS